jgi:hypothetical protein
MLPFSSSLEGGSDDMPMKFANNTAKSRTQVQKSPSLCQNHEPKSTAGNLPVMCVALLGLKKSYMQLFML